MRTKTMHRSLMSEGKKELYSALSSEHHSTINNVSQLLSTSNTILKYTDVSIAFLAHADNDKIGIDDEPVSLFFPNRLFLETE